MKNPLFGINGNRDNAVGKFSEERAEAQKKGFAARGSFGADDEIAFVEKAADAAGVGVAVAGESDGADGGN